tara:strand:+ start:327 stop:1130 length:804 start_codon:yes stop_codon:yes gene_type:complete
MKKLLAIVICLEGMWGVSAIALTVNGLDISRANFRQIQKDSHYPRVEKLFNTVFFKRHFEESGEPSELLRYLIETAKRYDVPPEAVLGALMGEHSMNQRGAMKQSGEQGINLFGKAFGKVGEDIVNEVNVRFRGANGQASFGPGQIQPFVAQGMQSEIERVYPDASEEERDKYTMKGAFNIMAAYMNYAANVYEAAGFEGEKSPRYQTALIVTLYNIGESWQSFEKRAERTMEEVEAGEREGPWLNYFGYWVQKNHNLISKKIAEAE